VVYDLSELHDALQGVDQLVLQEPLRGIRGEKRIGR
jgi:hypothetical protein